MKALLPGNLTTKTIGNGRKEVFPTYENLKIVRSRSWSWSHFLQLNIVKSVEDAVVPLCFANEYWWAKIDRIDMDDRTSMRGNAIGTRTDRRGAAGDYSSSFSDRIGNMPLISYVNYNSLVGNRIFFSPV